MNKAGVRAIILLTKQKPVKFSRNPRDDYWAYAPIRIAAFSQDNSLKKSAAAKLVKPLNKIIYIVEHSHKGNRGTNSPKKKQSEAGRLLVTSRGCYILIIRFQIAHGSKT